MGTWCRHALVVVAVCMSATGGYDMSATDRRVGPSEREKVQFLFTAFDVRPNDGRLGYDELELLQYLTDPQLPLDALAYRYIVTLLGGDLRRGLTLLQFNSSYYLHRDRLGTDLHKDYAIIRRVLERVM